MSKSQIKLPASTITLYSEESGSNAEKLEVSLQEKYTGTTHVIPNSLSNILCTELGIDGLLHKLNEIFDTSYSFTVPAESMDEEIVEEGAEDDEEWSDVEDHCDDMFDQPIDTYQHPSALASILMPFVHERKDFGTAYAYVRPWWSLLGTDPTYVKRQMLMCEMDDTSMREFALSQWAHQTAPTIDPPDTPPRRVWDLFANRVVPYYVVSQSGARGQHPRGGDGAQIVGVSHSWARAEERTDVLTPVNARAWPAPIPTDTTLSRVRIELLNLGIEHAWLDVLCLRQASADGVGEALRADEWQLDVPTIGNVYRAARARAVVHYYSGLGRPFRIGDMHDERHWLNRAWTLQELSAQSIVAGLAPYSPALDAPDAPDAVRAFTTRLAALHAFAGDAPAHVFAVLAAMRHRACTSELDKICGLAYLLRSRRLPPYVLAEGAEPAWARFLETVDARYRADLLFLFPAPGVPHAAAYRWAPGWEQVKCADALPDCEGIDFAEEVWYDSSWHIYRHEGPRIDDVYIEGLSDSTQEAVRNGAIVARDKTGAKNRFAAQAQHRQDIPDGHYLLQGSANYQFWVVGLIGPEIPTTREKGTVVKVSVIRLSEEEARRLQSLAIAEVKRTGFV